MRWLSLCVVAVATVSALWATACSTTNTTQLVCPQTLSFPAALVYPAASATRVPANIGTVIVQGGFAGHNVSIAVVTALPPALTLQMPVGPPPVPLPSPLSTPASLAGYPLGSIALPQLANYTQYGVLMVQSFPGSPVCPAVTVPLGEFTTAL
jgi:hypothetical protein